MVDRPSAACLCLLPTVCAGTVSLVAVLPCLWWQFRHVIFVHLPCHFCSLANTRYFVLLASFSDNVDSDSSATTLDSPDKRRKSRSSSKTPPAPADDLLQEQLLSSDLDEVQESFLQPRKKLRGKELLIQQKRQAKRNAKSQKKRGKTPQDTDTVRSDKNSLQSAHRNKQLARNSRQYDSDSSHSDKENNNMPRDSNNSRRRATAEEPAAPKPTMAKLQKDITQLEKINDELRQDADADAGIITKSEQKIKSLELKIKSLQKDLEEQASQAVKLVESNSMVAKVVSKTKSILFSRVKFFANDTQLVQATKRLYDLVFDPEQRETFAQGHQQSWVNTYKPHVSSSINDKRNYAQSQTKEAVLKYYEEHEILPTLAMIWKCLTGQVDMQDMDQVGVMEWVWDVLCPKVVGSTSWGPRQRHYNTMLQAKVQEDRTKKSKLFSASTIAFIYLLCENCWGKWRAIGEYKKENEGRNPPKKPTIAELNVMRANNQDLPNMAMYTAIYTNPDQGQATYGGWSKGGLDKFNILKKQVKTQWDTDNGVSWIAFEKEFLRIIKTNHNITCNDPDSEAKHKRKKRKSGEGVAVEVEEEVDTADWSDGEEEEGEGVPRHSLASGLHPEDE